MRSGACIGRNKAINAVQGRFIVSDYLVEPQGHEAKLIAHLQLLLDNKQSVTDTLLINAKTYKQQSSQMWDKLEQILAK